MNILFIYYKGVLPNAGGVARITSSLTRLFREKGCNVSLLGVKDMSDEGYDTHQLFFPSQNDIRENSLYFDDICSKERYNIIISQIPFIHTWVYDILEKYKPKFGYRVISCLHNPVMSQIKNIYYRKGYVLRNHGFLLEIIGKRSVVNCLSWLYKLKNKRAYTNMLMHSDCVTVLCKGMYDELLELMGVNTINKVSVIPNFIDGTESDKGLSISREKMIIWCGDVNFDVKRVDVVLRVWEQLSILLTDWKLYILGDGGGLKEAKDMAESLGLKNCFFEGRVDPNPYYRRAVFSIVTSSYESFSLVTLESLHNGVIPIVFNTFPAASLLIEDNVTGYLVKPYDIDKAVKIVSKIALDKNKIAKMSRLAEQSSKDFSREKIFECWRELFVG